MSFSTASIHRERWPIQKFRLNKEIIQVVLFFLILKSHSRFTSDQRNPLKFTQTRLQNVNFSWLLHLKLVHVHKCSNAKQSNIILKTANIYENVTLKSIKAADFVHFFKT